MMNLILMTHGELGTELLKTSKMLIGDVQNLEVFQIKEDTDLEEIEEHLKGLVCKADNFNQFLIMCDIQSGTPFNIAVTGTYQNENVEILYGINLPVLISILMSDKNLSLLELKKNIQEEMYQTIGFCDL